MTPPLRREQLNQQSCMHPDHVERPCNAFSLSCRHHPANPVIVIYFQGLGLVRLTCSVCQRLVVDVEVAP